MPVAVPLQSWPNSGFPVPFAFEPTFDSRAGTDGVTSVELMQVNWTDLDVALQALLGYSWRDTSVTPTRLRRKLPWQHPYFVHLWVKNISHIEGIQPQGNSESNPVAVLPATEGGVGPGYAVNRGPWSEFSRARLTVNFQRPPYFIRTDSDVLDTHGNPQEWLRYVDRDWKVGASVLSRDAAQFVWSGAGALATGLPGGLGQVVTKMELRKTWFELPEACVYSIIGSVPVGIPRNLVYTQTATTNPITGFSWPIGSAMLDTVNTPIGGGVSTQAGTTTAGSPTVTALTSTAALNLGDAVIGTGVVTGTYVAGIPGANSITMSTNATASGSPTLTFVSDPTANQLFGCRMGTLLYRGPEPRKRPLQLPPYLMQIPYFAGNEAISQVQYDVDLVWEYFQPPTKEFYAPQGHNLMPWSRDGFWYPVNSQASLGFVTTPFQYADHSDIFKVL
jgi:hypothetical protein